MNLLKKLEESKKEVSRKKKSILLVKHLEIPLENFFLPECLYVAREVTSAFYRSLLNILLILHVIYLIAFNL